MMNAQQRASLSGFSGGAARQLPAGLAWPLGRHGGDLEVLAGRVWLTRAGEPDDHWVEGGQVVRVAGSGEAVIEAWDEGRPAIVAWHPRRFGTRAADAFRSAFGRCWELVDPLRRIGAGTAAALVALLAGALLFGPLSDLKTRALLVPAVLHNDPAIHADAARDGAVREGSNADAAVASRQRARIAAQETRRRPAVPA